MNARNDLPRPLPPLAGGDQEGGRNYNFPPRSADRLLTQSRASLPSRKREGLTYVALTFTILLLSACNPTVKLEAPDKPITINLNVNISHEVRVKIDRDLDNVLQSDKGLF